MSAFLDTNLLVYAQQPGAKGERARTALASGGYISAQVLNEFVAVAKRKLGKDWDAIDAAIDDVLALVDAPVQLSLATNSAARALARDHGLSFYDALIVASALEAGCETLFTEDMQDGRKIGTLTIRNPFAGTEKT